MKLFVSLATLSLLSLAFSRAVRAIPSLFSTDYLPHRFCYLAQPALIWTNVVSDALIAASYAALFATLLWITFRLRKVEGMREYVWIFLSFAIFIVACGATHVMEVVTVWIPAYPLSAAVKVFCALASVPTAILFARITPMLVKRIPDVIDSLALSQQQRDEARTDLSLARIIIAEQKIKDQQMTELNTQFNHIMDSTSECILKLDHDWTIRYANRRALEISSELVVGGNFWTCFPSLRATVSEEKLLKAMQQRVPLEYRIFVEIYEEWFRVNVYPTPGGISMFYLPITAEKRLEEQIRTERAAAFAEINSVMDSTAEGILKLGLDWTVLYGNRVARDILPDLVIGNNYWECFPGVRGTEAEAHLRYVMDERKEAAWENFYEPYREYYAAHAYPTEGGISIFFVPVTRRKLLEQQLEEERRLREKRIEALSAMAGGLAHEISNPLAIIHGTASELQRMAIEEFPLDAAEVARSSASIIFTSERASRILRGLRGFAREAGHDPMEYASIYDIVEQAFQLQEGRFERHSIELRMRGEEGIPTMLCRETQIGQIVTNLINNAYDAITQQECDERWVSVETSRNGAYVQVDVIDSGPGIDDEAKKHLMEPFFTTKTRGLGMGVGLSLSRAIANEHGGTLTLCEGGQHTCFRLSLPLDSQPQAAHPLTIEEPSAAH